MASNENLRIRSAPGAMVGIGPKAHLSAAANSGGIAKGVGTMKNDKLRLNKETIRNLSDEHLGEAAGGKKGGNGGQSAINSCAAICVTVSGALTCICSVVC